MRLELSFHNLLAPVKQVWARMLSVKSELNLIYLHSHLCFESSNSKRNKVIKLTDIIDIQKVSTASVSVPVTPSGTLWEPQNVINLWFDNAAEYKLRSRCLHCPSQYKVLSVLPGSGMGISIATPSTQKVTAQREVPWTWLIDWSMDWLTETT